VFIKYLQDKGIRFVKGVPKGFNPLIDEMTEGSKEIELSGWIKVGAVVFTPSNGEREGLITNLEEGEVEEAVLPELYNKRWPIQKLELENFSGRLVDNIKQDFYGMMTVANMPVGALREANQEIQQEGVGKELK
jgi:hypothetical protein